MAPTGSIVLQAPLHKARLSHRKRKPGFGEIMCGVSQVIEANTIVLPGWGIQWDDWRTMSNYDDKALYVMICDVNFLVLQRPACRGMVLQPTKHKRGQYERIGLVTFNNAESKRLLDISKNWDLLDETSYLDLDIDKGYTIEVV
jgi:hypothetical protein